MNYKSFMLFSVLIVLGFSLETLSQESNWEIIKPDSCMGFEVLNDSTFFAIFNGNIEFSADGGKNWINKNPELAESNSFNKATFDKINNSFYVYNEKDMKIYQLRDSVDEWLVSLKNASQISDIISKNGFTYALGIEGELYITQNNGETWDSISVLDTLSYKDFNAILVASNGQIFIKNGRDLYTSKDSGKIWKEAKKDVYGFALNSRDELFIPGVSYMYFSQDYGETWNIISPNNKEGKFYIDENDYLYLGRKQIYRSKDNGVTWDNLGGDFNVNYISRFNDILYVASSNGFWLYDSSKEQVQDIRTNYFPLHINNKYQFRALVESMEIYDTHTSIYTIEKDSIINGQKYYLYMDKWLRYSEEDNTLYIWYYNSARVYLDFNLSSSAQFIHYKYSNGYATVRAGTTNVIDSAVNFKGYHIDYALGLDGAITELFAEGYGLFSSEYRRINGPNYYALSRLIMAVIYDSSGIPHSYSKHYKPVITVSSPSIIEGNNLNAKLTVDHPYSAFYALDSPHKGLNFIDSVILSSYYYREDSVIANDDVYLQNISKTNQYLTNVNVDTLLLKEGFTFNYKIKAIDKGLIPENSFAPDTGYYQCRYENIISGIGKYKKLTDFNYSLLQNYPNPFNPNTTIEYHLAKAGNVSLKIYDILGREIIALINNEYEEIGNHKISFNGSSLASGVYYYKLNSGDFSQTKKMILMK